MTNSQISDFGAAGILLGLGLLIALTQRKRFDLRWLLAAIALVLVNNFLLARGYGLIPNLVEGDRNWTGKALALIGTLVIAALPMFGWKRVGLTLKQRAGSLVTALPVAALYCGFFVLLAMAFPNEPATGEELGFQLTMPGLEEEPYYRGILLFAFDQAFRGRLRFLGVDWGWGALLSSVAFGLTHAFGYSDGAFSIDWMTMALTTVPSFLAVWVRYRTGSLLLPIVMHNFGNTAMTVL